MKKTVLIAIIIITAPIAGMQRGDAANASCSGLGSWAPDRLSYAINSLPTTAISHENPGRQDQIDRLSAVLAPRRSHVRTPSHPLAAVHNLADPLSGFPGISPELTGAEGTRRYHAHSPLPAPMIAVVYHQENRPTHNIPGCEAPQIYGENALNDAHAESSPSQKRHSRTLSPMSSRSSHTTQSSHSRESREIEDICEKIENLLITSPKTTADRLTSFKTRFTQAKKLLTDIMTQLEDPSVSINSLEKEISMATISIRKLKGLPLPDEQEFLVLKQETERLAAVLYRVLQPTDISPATSPAKRKAVSSVPSPLRPYTRHAQTNASHRAFQGVREGNSLAAALERLRTLISDETLRHYDAHAIFACDIAHVAEGHVISGNTEERTLEDIVAANARIHSPVYRENKTGIVYARNTDLEEAPLKSFFDARITREDIGPLLKSLNNPEKTTCLATTQNRKIELLCSEEYGFTLSLIAHTRYNKDGIPSRVPTLYPIFSCTIISPHARHDDKVRIVDASELTRNEPFILDCTVSELSKIVISIREGDEELKKECCFESKDPDYMVVDIAPFLARQGNFPIKQGVFIKIPKIVLLTEELTRD